MSILAVPFGLLRARLGRRTCLHHLAGKLATPIDFTARSLLERAADLDPQAAAATPVFVVGPPRCGSTVLYQYLASVLDVTYTSTLWSLLPRRSDRLPNGWTLCSWSWRRGPPTRAGIQRSSASSRRAKRGPGLELDGLEMIQESAYRDRDLEAADFAGGAVMS